MKFQGFIFLFLILLCVSCSKPGYITNDGQAYGSYYHIVYESPDGKDFHPQIEERLKEYTMVFSTFEKESEISKVNRNEPVVLSKYFINCFNKAQEVSAISGGAFDITVMPMVNAWGFGFKHRERITPGLIDSLKAVTGYQTVRLEDRKIIKQHPETMLDMAALASGYTSDLIAEFLSAKGCKNFLVDMNGEVVAKGVNAKGNTWSIGINEPIDDKFGSDEVHAVVHLDGKALATSGNYRNFYVEDGVKYAHTIDPKTGYPVQHSLLSSTVLANDGITADAFATVFMVIGLEKGIELAKQVPGIEVYFIYADSTGANKTYYSENFKRVLVE
jgi:FAD:protein FMN transferase